MTLEERLAALEEKLDQRDRRRRTGQAVVFVAGAVVIAVLQVAVLTGVG